ncbi:Uncharacterised protein [Klebsiella pneumoniae]|nr:Uncharacterised protein [Klebsiella pneumoniae]
MEYEAYKVRGYGFGLKKEITGVLDIRARKGED